MALIATKMSLSSHHNLGQPANGLPSAAQVLDFICMFTHDLKRKQKRWQDGRLKFHTFNKRVMVYDDRGNFMGDVHWLEEFDFGEGEEIKLERGAVIVQVAECVGSKDQDLTELLDKRAKEVEQRQARSSVIARPPFPSSHSSLVSGGQPHVQFKQQHLADTPRGIQGRAMVTTTSPYEERMAAQASSPRDDKERPPKRRKQDVSPSSKSGYAQNLFGATLTLSSWSAGTTVPSHPPRDPITQSSYSVQQRRFLVSSSVRHSLPRSSAVIDLTGGSSSLGEDISINSTAQNDGIVTENSKDSPSTTPMPVPNFPKERNSRMNRAILHTGYLESSTEKSSATRHSSHRNKTNASKKAVAKSTVQKEQDLADTQTLCLPGSHQTDHGTTRQPASTRLSVTKAVVKAHEPRSEHMEAPGVEVIPKHLSMNAVEIDTPEEPPAKLRIKVRRKRGLLILANKAVSKNPLRQGSPPNVDFSTKDGGVSLDDAMSRRSPAASHGSPRDDLAFPVSGGADRKADVDDERSGNIASGFDIDEDSQLPVGTSFSLELAGVSDLEDIESPSEQPLLPPKETQKQKRQSRPAKGRSKEAEATHSGPRLASLGRRGVKSKEIIGSFHTRQHRPLSETSTPVLTSREELITPINGTETLSPTGECADNSEPVATNTAQAARPMNPATKRRNAARKSDAAGIVPHVLELGEPGPGPAYGRRAGSKADAQTNSEGTDIPGESAMELAMPMFPRANGGPWSKEAYDLLGCRRPR